jgi:hypothetical protein
MFWPVTNRARSEQRNTTTSATSSGAPIRASGVFSRKASIRSGNIFSGSVSLVSIIPGETAFTRTVGAYSKAATAVSATIPALADAYGASPADGRVPEIDAVLTIAPPPASAISGAAARIPLNTPVRCTPTMSPHASGVYMCKGPKNEVPALLNITSSPPIAAAAWFTICATASVSRTSAVNA